MLSIDTVIVADAWLEFNGCVVWERFKSEVRYRFYFG